MGDSRRHAALVRGLCHLQSLNQICILYNFDFLPLSDNNCSSVLSSQLVHFRGWIEKMRNEKKNCVSDHMWPLRRSQRSPLPPRIGGIVLLNEQKEACKVISTVTTLNINFQMSFSLIYLLFSRNRFETNQSLSKSKSGFIPMSHICNYFLQEQSR